MGFCGMLVQRLIRRKRIDLATVGKSQLARVLTLLDLTALGIGATMGVGTYVVTAQVARETAGPAVILSFLIAAITSLLAGLCYAEFASRVPKAGSAYVYSYVTVGELIAFIIGWNLILEYIIGSAVAARAWSSNLDSLTDYTIQNYFRAQFPVNITGLSPYPDMFAMAITLLLTVILAVGVKESTRFNNAFTAINLLVILYVIICGLFKIDLKNWRLSPDDVKLPAAKVGAGGFFPFGIEGMMAGAATCFYTFIGFDCIATTGEEAINPEVNIPLSIVLSLTLIFVGYFGIATVITLMCPYFLLDPRAPVPGVFDQVGWGVAKYIIAVGAVCGLSTSLLGSMFPMPRVIYAMAGDGLIFRFLSAINDRFKTPLLATIISGILASIMAIIFGLKELVDMMSIGTLLAYTLVAISVLITRYRVTTLLSAGESPRISISSPTSASPLPSCSTSEAIPLYTQKTSLLKQGAKRSENSDKTDVQEGLKNNHRPPDLLRDLEIDEKSNRERNSPKTFLSQRMALLRRLFNPTSATPTDETETLAIFCTGVASLLIIALNIMIVLLELYLEGTQWWSIVVVVLLMVAIVVVVVIIRRQPQNTDKVSFKVPFLPVLPLLSTFINVYLMLRLSTATWIRFGVWMTIGFVIYFGYGLRHSSLENRTLVRPESQNYGATCTLSDDTVTGKPSTKNDLGSKSLTS